MDITIRTQIRETVMRHAINQPLGLLERFRSFLGGGGGRDSTPKLNYYAKVFWHIKPGKKPGHLVAVCNELGLSVGGDGHQELLANIQAAFGLLVTDLVEDGEVEEYFRKRGVEFSRVGHANMPGVNILIDAGQHDSQQAFA